MTDVLIAVAIIIGIPLLVIAVILLIPDQGWH